MKEFKWNKKTYQSSISSKCWFYTPYDTKWEEANDYKTPISEDRELAEIVEMEKNLNPVPKWAKEIVKRSINWLPGCGHYSFPQPFIEVVEAIGSQKPPEFVHCCFSVDRKWKRQMQDYVFLLDAWLAGASAEEAALELKHLGFRKIDWKKVCKDMWEVLGKRTEIKELLVERLIHSQRHKIKERVWEDDLASEFGRDQYLGVMNYDKVEYVGTYSDYGNPGKDYSYIKPPVPGYIERSSPRAKKLEEKLKKKCPDWEWFLYTIQYGWLCSPKAFRFLERLLWAIGKERQAVYTGDHRIKKGDKVPGFLQCRDTYLSKQAITQFWEPFKNALEGWWQKKPGKDKAAKQVNKLLGKRNPAKEWLVRLYLRKLRIMERDNRFIAGKTAGSGGTRVI